jgi:hypothetical protein
VLTIVVNNYSENYVARLSSRATFHHVQLCSALTRTGPYLKLILWYEESEKRGIPHKEKPVGQSVSRLLSDSRSQEALELMPSHEDIVRQGEKLLYWIVVRSYNYRGLSLKGRIALILVARIRHCNEEV